MVEKISVINALNAEITSILDLIASTSNRVDMRSVREAADIALSMSLNMEKELKDISEELHREKNG